MREFENGNRGNGRREEKSFHDSCRAAALAKADAFLGASIAD
jgi:hypothetical protein